MRACWRWVWIIGLVWWGGLPAQAEEIEVVNSWNKASVRNNPSHAPAFTLNAPATVVYIDTYHWNSGRGSAGGRISLVDQDGRTHGPWAADMRGGMGEARNVHWVVEPHVQLPPGTYFVTDSDPQTWSHNRQSGGVGFARVVVETQAAAAPAGPLDVTGRYGLASGDTLDLVQSGNRVSGRWSNGSTILDARLEGQRLTGTYRYRPDTPVARFAFTFDADGRCYEGTWEDAGHSGTEKGCRVP